MKLTDFRPGQTVIVLNKMFGRPYAEERKVEKVGRKYVTLAGRWNERFYVLRESDDFLLQAEDMGEKSLLFPTETAYDEYCERKELDREISKLVGLGGSGLSLTKLRKIKKIIDEEDTHGRNL